MPRLVHIAGSVVVVLVAYWTYAFLAVPFIEPRAQRHDRPGDLGSPSARSGAIKELNGLFAESDWELHDPKVIESDRAILLVQKYDKQDDGWVDLFPFTVVFLPQGQSSDEAERARGAVVLQAPEGARLRFDKSLDLGHMKIGRLVEGQLHGPVTIRSQGKQPGPEDDLWVNTRELELTEHHIWTPHPVDFRWGPHYGRGRDMHIYLLPRDAASRPNASAPNIGGIERFEVNSVERLHMDMAGLPGEGRQGGATEVRGQGAEPGAAANASANPSGVAAKKILPLARISSAVKTQVEVTCRGPFQFNLVQQVATFRDQVDVLRIHPTGQSDQLSCQLLSIYFTKAAKPGTAPRGGSPGAPAFDLQPQRIEALGQPAVLHAPSNHVKASGQRLTYDFLAGRVVLEDPVEVTLQQGANEIRAPYLEYQTADAGRLGQVKAKGPGWLCGQMDQRPGQPLDTPQREPLEARWKSELLVQPEGRYQVICLKDGAALSFRQIGQLSAREIRCWLIETPPAPAGHATPPKKEAAPARLQPDHMLAEGDVRISSPQLSSALERLEIAFEPIRQAQGGGLQENGRGPESRVQGSMVAGPQGGNSDPQTLNPNPLASDRRQHVEVVGRLMRARVQMAEQKNELSELTIEGGARFAETQTAQPGEQPLLVTGERIHVADANRPQTNVTVIGQPAHFQGRGLSLTGPNINLNRGSNRVWIDGAGRMLAPLDRDLEGRPLRTPGQLQVDWKRRMQFDGRTAQFEESVTANAPSQQLQTQSLEVQFRQPVRFSDAKPQQPPQVEQLVCRGGVLLDNSAMQGQQQMSRDRMQAADLAVNWTTGALTAGGPGWVVSVRRGGADAAAGLFSRGPADPPRPALAAAAVDQLNCLHLRFLGSITGNVHRRELVFHDQVRTAYGPADSWQTVLDVDNPSEQGGILRSDHLQVNDMTPMGSGGQAMELLASGNVVAEGKAPDGKNYTARAIRMSYAQAKDLLVLEGDGRSDAELFLQQGIGGVPARTAARKIFFWTQTHRVKIEGARSLEMNQFPGQPGKKPFSLPGVPGVR